MTAKELLGVFIRAAGLALIGCGLLDLAHLAMRGVGLSGTSQYPVGVLAAAVVVWFVLGLATIVSADLVVRLVYRRGS